MANNAALIYQMFRKSPAPGATSIGAISGKLDELRKDKRWREEYDLKKKQIESAIGYKDLMTKLQEEKAERDRKDFRKLDEYKRKNLIAGQMPVTAQTGLSPYADIAKAFGETTSGLPGMGAFGKGLAAFGGGMPETITAKPTPATIEERRRGLYRETFPEKVYGKEPAAWKPKTWPERKAEIEAGKNITPETGYKTMAEIPEAPEGMAIDKIKTNKWGKFEPTYKKVDENGEPSELFATFKECQTRIKKMGYKAVPKRDSKTGKYYPSYKEPSGAGGEITPSLQFQKEKYAKTEQEKKDAKIKDWFTNQVVDKDGKFIKITDKKKYDLLNKYVPKINKLRGKDGLPPVELKLHKGFGRDYWQLVPKTITGGEEIQYTSAQEQTIQDNIKAYGKSREEVISALKAKGLL